MEQEPIAIIGMGCRFPGPDGQTLTTPDAFWELLCSGADIARPVPASRWDVDAVYDPTPETPGKLYVREGYWLEDIDRFDAEFFQFAAREAAAMDPQQRLLLEVSWEALEAAALPPTSLAGSQTGIFMSSFWDDYSAQRLYTGSGQQIGRYALLSTMRAMAAGRLAHLLGVHGPNLMVDTACAASLTAVHLACQALRAGECDLALAGGAYLLFGPENMVGWCQMGTLAPDGRSKTFDQRADGFGMGEGVGVVVLKPLAAALAAGDRIMAVIRGSALNHGGRGRTVTTPSGQAQQALLRQALRQAGVAPHAIQYVETHGTGTKQGDPIEVTALGEVLGTGRVAAGVAPLLIGSVKSNIGHLNAAAGMAGLFKTVLALQHAAVPPTLHLTQLNPRISWDTLAVVVPTTLTPWPESAEPRMAGVSAFGISGSNAHVILEAAPETLLVAREEPRPLHLLPIAARDAAGLDAYVQAYMTYLDANPDVNLGDLCYTAQVGRSTFAHRLSVVAGSVAELRARLGQVAAGQTDVDVRRGVVAAQQPAPKVAFLFTGHGGQYAGMGLELDATEATFHAALDECAALLDGKLDRPLREVLTDEEALERLTYQPALFAVEYALARLWQTWGVEADLLIGHSMGELVAACLAGVFSLEDGLKLVTARGRLMGALPQDGAMVSIAADEARVREAMTPYTDEVAIAAVNGPASVVISGRATVTLAIAATFAADGIKTQRLKISHASHSPLIEPMLEEFRAVAETVAYHAPTQCLVSNVTGGLAGAEVATPDYWVRHVRETVRFADGVQTLHAQGVDVFLEIGPKPVLLGMVEHNTQPPAIGYRLSAIGSLPSLRPGQGAWQTLLASLGALYVRGAAIDWAGVHQGVTRHKIGLPTYPFQRQRYWVEAPAARHREAVRPLVDQVIHLPQRGETICETTFSVAAIPFLAEHLVYGEVVSPGACQLTLALSAAELSLGTLEGLSLRDVILPQALVLPEGQARTVQAILSPAPEQDKGARVFTITSFVAKAAGEASAVATHATGMVTRGSPVQIVGDLAALQQRCREPLILPVREDGPLTFGPTFRWIEEAWQRAAPTAPEVLARLVLPTAVSTLEGYPLHPGLLDACFQVTLLQAPVDQGALLPFALAALDWIAPATGGTWWCHACQTGPLTWDVHLFDEAGTQLVAISGFQLRAAPANAIQGTAAWQDWLYTVSWKSQAIFGMPPAYLPPPAQALPPLESGAVVEPDLRTALDTFSLSAVLNAFATAGVPLHVGTRWVPMQLIQQLGVIPSYRRLLRRLVGILAEAGVIAPDGEGWRVAQAWPVDFADACAALETTAGDAPEARLLVRCGRRLGETLRGVQEPLELLFPAGDASDAERLYRETPAARVRNGLVQAVVRSACERLPTERGLRVLEIGAGTGGTTAGVLPLLPAEQSAYTFTDIGPSFLRQAEARFRDYPFVRYQTLDVEQSSFSQGFTPAQADLVIAANVLHATRNLGETLSHVRELLAPGGQLVLLEATERERWVDLTFGLTEGWWRFADERTDHPLLPAAAWESLLLAHGFASVAVTEYAGQAVIVAQADQAWPVAAARDWLIFADRQGVGAALATGLRERGDQVWEVYADAPGFVPEGTQARAIDPDAAEAYQQVVGLSPHWHGVVHLWSLDMPGVEENALGEREAPAQDLVAANRQGCGAALLLTQALLARQDGLAGLWLVTHDSQAVAAGDAVTGVVQAGLWGMGKVIGLEHPELRPVCVDLRDAGTDQVNTLVALLSAPVGPEPREAQVALRAEGQYVARLQRTKKAAPAHTDPISPDGPYHLEIVEPGFLERLALVPLTRRAPAAGEVEIQVEACGLNFRDVMEALNLFPFTPMALGKECAGTITRVGPGVSEDRGLAVGDRVVACAQGSFSQYVVANAALVAPIPASLSATKAAGIPINFLTAHYALHTVAHIQAGETVLIHAAAGGTGMAAVQIAQAAGAVVYATASPHKWPVLQAMGVQHLYHSRTLDFGAQILRDTGGRGVDMVLNSLTSEGFIPTSIGLLAPAGRFVELAQRNIWSPAEVGALRPDVRYTVMELLDEIQLHPQQIGALLQQVMGQFTTGTLRPLPTHVSPVTQAVAAFRMMQHARHVGKIVLTLAATPEEPAVAPAIRPDATYLITGGLGGLGLAVADWMVAAGARHLLLMGRRAPDAAAQARLDAMHAHGAVVQVAQADVADMRQLRAVLHQIPADAPLAGIIHSVGVLDDGALLNQDWTRFSRVLVPKIQGAWQLHQLTQGMQLDFMVLFSSVASLIGSAGQCNHAAANAFLDALAAYRQARGLPALSINWGRWAEIGAAAELVRTQQNQPGQQGMGAIAPAQGIAAFAHLLGWQVPQVGVVAIHWPALREQGATAFDAELRQVVVLTPVVATPAPRAVAEELRSASPEVRRSLLLTVLRTAVAGVLGMRDPTQIDPSQGLMAMGVDSLMAVELRNHLARDLEISLPSTLIFDHPTITALCVYLEKRSGTSEPTTPAPVQPPHLPQTTPEPEIMIADDDIAAMLAQAIYTDGE